MKKPGVLCFFFFICFMLHAQKGVSVSASVDKQSILIGEPLQLTLEATFSNTHAAAFFTVDSLSHFEVLHRAVPDSTIASGRKTIRQVLTLTSWDSGAWVIPAFPLRSQKGVATKPLVVNVAYTPMPPDKDYNDVKDILETAKPPRQKWYWYLIGVALLLVLLLLIFPKRKKAPPAAPPVITERAFDKAMHQLEALRTADVPDDKIYFTELILIFRTYLQHGKGIHSFQQTTDDLGRQLQALALPHEDLKKLITTLQLSDFVKFAQYKPTGQERDQAWSEIKRSITAIEQIK
jgi:hypothetical protein